MKDRSPQLTVASVRKKWQPRRLLRSHKKAKHGRGHNKGSRVWSSSPLGGPPLHHLLLVCTTPPGTRVDGIGACSYAHIMGGLLHPSSMPRLHYPACIVGHICISGRSLISIFCVFMRSPLGQTVNEGI